MENAKINEFHKLVIIILTGTYLGWGGYGFKPLK